MNPPNHRVAGRQAADLLERRLRRLSKGTRRRHIQRAEQIAQVIWKRWHVGVYRWRLKHVKWYLDHIGSSVSDDTLYQHRNTVKKLVTQLEKPHWISCLD
jgi:hypothetical protein